jgi:hypothetical protein
MGTSHFFRLSRVLGDLPQEALIRIYLFCQQFYNTVIKIRKKKKTCKENFAPATKCKGISWKY